MLDVENEKMKKCKGNNCQSEIYKEDLCYEHYRKYIHWRINLTTAGRV